MNCTAPPSTGTAHRRSRGGAAGGSAVFQGRRSGRAVPRGDPVVDLADDVGGESSMARPLPSNTSGSSRMNLGLPVTSLVSYTRLYP